MAEMVPLDQPDLVELVRLGFFTLWGIMDKLDSGETVYEFMRFIFRVPKGLPRCGCNCPCWVSSAICFPLCLMNQKFELPKEMKLTSYMRIFSI